MLGVGQTEAGAAKVTAANREMAASAKGAEAAGARAATSTSQKWTSAGATAAATGKKLNRGLTLPILAIGAVTGKMAVDFEKSMRNVNSIAQLPEPTFHKLEGQVLNLAGKTAQAPITLSEGLYDLVSSGFKAGDAITVLEASAKGATAGLTTTEVSTKAVAAALNAYHLPASKAKAITDDLFQTVNLGVVTFDELASTIGYVLPAAATMGVDLKQVGASISTLTKEGQSSSNAVTNINAALTAFIKPSKAMGSILDELGYKTSEQLIHQLGFQGALEKVTGAVHGNKEAIGKLFPNVRAMRAVFGLTGDAAKGAAKDLRGFQSDSGATAKVLHEQQKSLAYQWNELKAEAGKLGIELGKKLIPEIRSLATTAMGAVHWFLALPPGVQDTTLKMLAFGAVLGPVLTIGGNLVKVLGLIGTGIKTLAGLSIVGEITAALSMSGERIAALEMVGAEIGTSVMAGLATALPIAAAGAGIVNILSSVIGGDSKGAMEKTGGAIGGALIGGIAGSVIPGIGTIMGAAVGGGVGSFLGPMIGGLFDSEKKIGPLQKRLQSSAKGVADSMRNERDAAHSLAASNQRLVGAKQRQQKASDNVRRAEKNLEQVQRNHKAGTIPVLHAEIALAEAKHRNAKASQEVKNAERLQGYERKIQMPILRTAILETRHRINVLKDEREALRKQAKQMVENGSTEKERRKWNREMTQNTEDLSKVEKRRNETLSDANRLIGTKFAKSLEHARTANLELFNTVANQGKTVPQHYHEMAEAVFGFTKGSEHHLSRVRGAYEKTKGVLGPFQTELTRQLNRGKTDVWGFANATGKAFGQVETSTNTALTNLHVKQISFGVTSPQKKAQGGMVRIPGTGTHDTVPLNVMGQPVIAAPGEDIAFLTQHQRADLDFAVRHVYGDGDLERFFNRQNRPHYEPKARGGIVEPRMTGPDPLREGGQHAIHAVTAAARAYVRSVGGDKTYKAIVDNGNRMDALHQPYLWGGGHGSTASRNGPWDCSGGTTELYNGAGWKELTPMVSSGFSGFGSPGKGKVSILSNAEHVYSVVGNRAIGTSGENPGGGFGWINGYTYRPGFTTTHVDLLGEGAENLRAGGGKGQKPAKGFSRGGILHFSTGGSVPPKGGELVGASYYGGPTDGVSGTTGAAGVSLPGTSSFAELAMGHALGGLPFHTKLKFSRSGKSIIAEKLDIGAGGDSVNGKNRAVDFWYEAGAKLGIGPSNGVGLVRVEPTDGSATTKTEDVPAVFHGAQTGSINFPSVPKTLHGVEKMIGQWSAKLTTYRHAVKAAKSKPKLLHALEQNVAAIEGFLTKLRHARSLLRRKAAEKKASRRLQKKLGKITGLERRMEEAERAYTIAEQGATQIVDLEPQQPQLKSDATEAERAAAEKQYVEAFSSYVDQQEKPAWGGVLDVLAGWRNVTLLGETTAGRLETGFEKEVRGVDHEIDDINNFTEKVTKDKEGWKRKHPKADFPDWLKAEIKKDHEQRARLPVLRFRDREGRKTLGEAREAFYPGRKEPLEPPAAPMPGSGSIEDMLIGIQGTHWPDQHSAIRPLPGKRAAGQYGGSIWDVQGTIEELGLKINDAVSGLGGGEVGSGNSDDANREHDELLEAENAQLKRDRLVALAQSPVLKNYLGAYETGGILPDTGFYLGHKGEEVVPADQVGQDGGVTVLEPHIHLSGAAEALEGHIDARIELRDRATGRTVGVSRATPSVAGRKAIYHQGRRGR
jgi:TP901 family phage tail tape measure protein